MKKFLLKKNKNILFLFFILFCSFSKGDTNLFEISKNLDVFNDIYKNINIKYVDDIAPGEFMKTGINAMLNSLDPYTVYYPESNIEEVKYMKTGQYGGIGTNIDTINNLYTITSIVKNGPANKANIHIGDVILKVDSKPVYNLEFKQVLQLCQGAAGTTLNIELKRGDKIISKNIQRAQIKTPDVPYSGMVDSTVGYIKLNSFTQTASLNVKNALLKLQEKNCKKLILDLRNNGGGLLREAVNIVNLFVAKKTEIVVMRGKESSSTKKFITLNNPIAENMPLVVLINKNSASASEIVSGALQDLDRAIIIGSNSYGKGLVQQTEKIIYGGVLKVTVAKYYTPSGRCVQKINYQKNKTNSKDTFYTVNKRPVLGFNGISPDVLVENNSQNAFIETIKNNYIIFKFANQFYNNNLLIDTSNVFTLSNTQYENFKKFVINQQFSYSSLTYKLLKELEKQSKQENYYSLIKNDIDNAIVIAKENKLKDLDSNKKVLTNMLEKEIIRRYYYEEGLIKFELKKDDNILSSVQILNDPQKLNLILKPIH
jgi:carboxyl-terminal processing protease